MKHNIILEDTTLRDGEQSPGVAFAKNTKIKIHDLLVEAGVKWIEIGIPAMGGEELETLKFLKARGSDANLVVWNRGCNEDIDLSLGLGFKFLHIGLPTSDLHLRHSINKNKKWLLEQARSLIHKIKDSGGFVSISAEDIARSDKAFLADYANTVYEAGANRLRLSDTIGILTPEKYYDIVEYISNNCSIDIQCHAHNDFGLATANTLAGLRAGARYFHVTVNGIGERAGMPDIAQVGLSLKQQYNIDLGLNFHKLGELSNYVSSVTKAPLPPWYPVFGRNVFAHESGIHVKGLINNVETFEPYPPELVGRSRDIIIGKHSGTSAIKHVLEQKGFFLMDSELDRCLAAVRDFSMKNERSLETQELLSIAKNISQGF